MALRLPVGARMPSGPRLRFTPRKLSRPGRGSHVITKSCLLIALLAALVAAPVLGLSSANPTVTLRIPIKSAGVKNCEPLDRLYGNLPLQFEPNQGQADPGFDFVTRGAG